MTAAAWIACGLLVVIIGLLAVIAWYSRQLEAAHKHLRWLSHQADELRQDYGAEIARSQRMARRVVEGGAR